MHFKNKVVVVTGATGALGESVAEAFLHCGARVVGTYRQERQARRLEEAMASVGKLLSLHKVDLSGANAVESFFSEVRDRHARVDVLINAAGGLGRSQPVHELQQVDLDMVFAMNFRTAFLCCRSVLPMMQARGRGRIVNVLAKPALAGVADLGAYGASKAALLNLSQTLAAENRKLGITVNCVVPSTIDTARNRQDRPDAAHDQWATPEDIARVIAFLASEDAAPVTGAAIPVYGRSG